MIEPDHDNMTIAFKKYDYDRFTAYLVPGNYDYGRLHVELNPTRYNLFMIYSDSEKCTYTQNIFNSKDEVNNAIDSLSLPTVGMCNSLIIICWIKINNEYKVYREMVYFPWDEDEYKLNRDITNDDC